MRNREQVHLSGSQHNHEPEADDDSQGAFFEVGNGVADLLEGGAVLSAEKDAGRGKGEEEVERQGAAR